LAARYVVDEVVELYDDQATAKAILDAFMRLNRALGPKDCLLIYYSGHGELDEALNTGFWIPVNGQPGEPATFVANDVIRRFVSGLTHAQHVLLFSDSCFAGDFFRATTPGPRRIDSAYYRQVWEKPSRKAMTSGAMQPVSDNGLGNHSPFAYWLIKRLNENAKPYLTPSTLFEWIKEGVTTYSAHGQQPLYGEIQGAGGLEGGEFVLFLRSPSEAPAPPPAPLPAQTPKPGDTQTNPKDGAEMVWIPPGEFLMGNDMEDITAFWKKFRLNEEEIEKLGLKHETPRHRVSVDGFWMYKYEVTNAQFEKFVKATGHKTEAENDGKSGAWSIEENKFGEVKGADWRHPRGPGTSAQPDHPVV
ncbi:MAG: hypothetical protein FJ278_24915, partial [Planctomycetes bacterium]|nr:hypothetical protein [Planctomycetota bacterium]